MTLGSIFNGAMNSTLSTFYGQYPTPSKHKVISDRDGYGYSYGKKSKSKSKSDKKHAAMSALTLLAFLFFLNILQYCLKEQTLPYASDKTMMMVMPSPQKNVKDSQNPEHLRNQKSDLWTTNSSRRSRSLLQASEEDKVQSRQTKFIKDYKGINRNWAMGLSQLSEKDLENQKTKTENLRNYLKRKKAVEGYAKVRNYGKMADEEGITPKYEYRTVQPRIIKRYSIKRNVDGDVKKSTQTEWVPGVGPILDQEGGAEEKQVRSDAVLRENEIQSGTPWSTHPVYSYYNHKDTGSSLSQNKTEVQQTTESVYYTSNPNPPLRRLPVNMRKRYPNYKRYSVDYTYSPYRKNYVEPLPQYRIREQYYPVAVTHPQEDVGFDLIKFVWTMLTGFAKPLARIVPTFGKVSDDDQPKCYDLLICEAHRVSKYMGPTAEALASTFSTLLTWYTDAENRQPLIEAVTSGRENTCQQQITNCDQRSGGKSAMTVIAQVLEAKFR